MLALEPNPDAFARLCENVALNDCGNVTTERLAASSQLGYAALHLPDGGDSSWSTLVDDRLDGTAAVDVEMSTLDYEVERHGLRAAVVKIDVEGAETAVLRGAQRVLERRPALLLELVEKNGAPVVSLLAKLGYLVARIGTRSLEPWTAFSGAANALFVQPWQFELLSRADRRAFLRTEQQVVGDLGLPVAKPVEGVSDDASDPIEPRERAEEFVEDRRHLEARLLDQLA